MERYLKKYIKTLALDRKKMAFISGPRQVGKTTLSKDFLHSFDQVEYRNWDETEFRRLWAKSPNSIRENFKLEEFEETKLLILDEIHKSSNWNQRLKGLFDELGNELCIIVTGSARLNIFKRGGDSLMGRYLNFRLHPLSYGEITDNKPFDPEVWKSRLFTTPKFKPSEDSLDKLLDLSGFPEPFFSNSKKISNIWRKSRFEKIIREDLRDLSRIPELGRVEMLASLLPEKVGSPLSVQSLREDIEVSHDTVTRWLNYLKELYYFFEIKPWSKSVARSLKKEGKVYMFDWTEVSEMGHRFENLIANHLLKACHFWTDTGEGDFDLHYLRNKDQHEIDFLITLNKKPWICVEAKLNETNMDLNSINKLTSKFNCPFVQVVRKPGIFKVQDHRLLMSASYFLAKLP